MLETIKNWLNDFKTDFDFDFDPMDCSFLNWLRSLLMMLGVYWLAVAVPMAIVNYFRGGNPIGDDSFYIRYLDLRPFCFTPKYVSQTVVRLLLVGMWCGVLMLYGIFIYPFTHASGGDGATDYGGGSQARDEPKDDGDWRERPRHAPQPDPPRSSQSQSPSSPQPQPPPRSEPKQPVIITAFKRGMGIYIRTNPGGDRYLVGDGWELGPCTSGSVTVWHKSDPRHHYIYDANGRLIEQISV